MLGLALPLYALYMTELVIVVCLLGPRTLSVAVAQVIRLSKSSVGFTVTITIALFLILDLFTSIYLLRYFQTKKLVESDIQTQIRNTEQEFEAILQCILCSANLTLLLGIRAWAAQIEAFEKLQKSHTALKKQAEGLSKEYSRATETVGSGAKQQTEVENRIEEMKKQVQKAEANQQAAKAQAEGVSKEYDRLLAEYDTLQRRLGQMDPQFSLADKKTD